MVKAESEGKNVIVVSILKSGEGLNTRYKVEEEVAMDA